MQRSAFLFNGLFLMAILGFIAQFFIDFNVINISAATIVLSASLITLSYLRFSDAFTYYPISSFAILGLLVTTLLGALVVQFVLWTSLTKDLRIPIETFSYLFMFQVSALIAHVFYRMLANTKSSKPSILRYTLEKMGLYATPSIVTIWVIGLIGLASALLAKGEGGSKVANGIQFIMWLPFIIPIYRGQLGAAYCNAKLQYFLLGLYTLTIIGIGIIFNARGLMLIGVVTLIAVAVLQTFRSKEKFTASELIRILLVLLLGLSMSLPLSDLSTAMVVTRADRGKISNFKLAHNTFEVMTSKRELIEQYREQGKVISKRSNYDEQYISNPLLARFVMTKFHDNMFYFGQKLNDAQISDLADYTVNVMSAMFPAEFLKVKWLNLNIDKLSYTYFSTGDYIVMLATGNKLGGFLTGSSLGQGMILFGFFAPFIFMLVCILIFYVKDLFSYKNNLGVVLIAPIGLFTLYNIFMYGLVYDGIQGYITDTIRNFPQSVILYSIIYQFARLLDAVCGAVKNYNSKNIELRHN